MEHASHMPKTSWFEKLLYLLIDFPMTWGLPLILLYIVLHFLIKFW